MAGLRDEGLKTNATIRPPLLAKLLDARGGRSREWTVQLMRGHAAVPGAYPTRVGVPPPASRGKVEK